MLVYLFLLYLYIFQCAGGDEESRTPDPLLARQMLYQLSYTPTYNIDYI